MSTQTHISRQRSQPAAAQKGATRRQPAAAQPGRLAGLAARAPGGLNPAEVRRLQRLAGNRAVQRLVSAGPRPAAGDRPQARAAPEQAGQAGQAPSIEPVAQRAAPAIQREWVRDGADTKWDAIVTGLQWYRTGQHYYFFIRDAAELPATLTAEQADIWAGDNETREVWQARGLPPPSDVKTGAALALSTQEIVQNILKFLLPSQLAKAFQVNKLWHGTAKYRDDLMRISFGYLPVVAEAGASQAELIARAQRLVPYRDLPQLSVATQLVVRPGDFNALAWSQYKKASNPSNQDKTAVLYSIRNVAEMQYWAALRGTTVGDMRKQGAVYSPWETNSQTNQFEMMHNMTVNKIWFLGVIHGGRNVVILSPLTPTTLTRGYNAHPEKKGGQGVSALGREILGATASRGGAGQPFFKPEAAQTRQVATPEERGQMVTQGLTRNPQATAPATLSDITLPEDMTSAQAAALLAQRGIHLQPEAGPSPDTYNAARFLLLVDQYMQDTIKIFKDKNKLPTLKGEYLKTIDWLVETFGADVLGPPSAEPEKIAARTAALARFERYLRDPAIQRQWFNPE